MGSLGAWVGDCRVSSVGCIQGVLALVPDPESFGSLAELRLLLGLLKPGGVPRRRPRSDNYHRLME